jgi:hypothetical protein
MIRVCWIALLMTISFSPVCAAQTLGRIDVGLGAGAGGISAGLALRGAAGLQVRGWGASFRAAGHVGQSTCDPCPFGIPDPEVIREFALVATHRITDFPRPLFIGIGVGRVSGDRDNPANPDRLIAIPSTWGAAFEAVWELGNGRGFGGGLAVQGNLNREASFVGVVLSGSLGFRTDAG